MKALREIGLRGIVYQESFGPDPRLADENVAKLREQLAEMRALESANVRAGVSPHAPYTVSAPQLEIDCAAGSRRKPAADDARRRI